MTNSNTAWLSSVYIDEGWIEGMESRMERCIDRDLFQVSINFYFIETNRGHEQRMMSLVLKRNGRADTT